MKTTTFITLFFLTIVASWAQEFTSQGDKYFYSYSYKEAILAYQKDLSKNKVISNHQYLNLADSYFKTGNYNEASKIYININSKDSIIDGNRFNMMLQSLSKTSEPERVRALLKSKSNLLSNELIENAQFNFELLSTDNGNTGSIEIFNSNGNSPQADFSPSFYKGSRLLFSSARPQKSRKVYVPSGESYLDIYIARIAQSGRIQNSNKFTEIPDSKYHKSTPQYSDELERIFYILSNAENGNLSFDDYGKNALAIGMVYEGGQFRYMLRDLSTSFYYPFFDIATNKLYFAANFSDGYGGTDLYFVYTNNGQIMSEPINLGPRINSPGNEIAPYIFDGGLYFSSDIFYGIGGMDVYKSNTLTDESFSIPVNLGRGINSEKDDFGLIIRENDKKVMEGYFASNRPGGKGNDDIYGFTMNQKPGLKTFAIRGKVVNLENNRGIDNAQVRIKGKSGEVIKEIFTSSDGVFRLEIPWQEQITIESTKSKFSLFSVTYTESALEEIQKKSFNMGIVALEDLVEEVEEKTVLQIERFFFARGKSNLDEVITAELDKVVDALTRFPQLKIQIESHTDSRGSSSVNKRLSQKRADTIKGYLLANGVSSSNIVGAIGYGEDKIMNSCTNGKYCLEFLHEQNMRTLFVIANFDQIN